MAAAAGLARRLRAALREEEPRAVEELLRRGADPNLVLADGVAAMHLAARARHSRGLRCLEALLHRGGDANARSVEALTPLHVAAAWGCRRGLELLLGHGADPTLRDQDGLGPLDLAEQQGHQDCAHVLRELQTRTKTSTRTRAESQKPEPEPEPGGPSPWGKGLDASPSGLPNVTLGFIALGRSDGRDIGLEAGPRLPSHLACPEIADKDSSLEYPPGQWDCSSDASFVTAIEASGTEDPAPHTSSWARSSRQTKQRLMPTIRPSQRTPRSPGTPQLVHRAAAADREAELNTCLQALTLTSPDASPSPQALPDGSPAQSPPREPLPGLPHVHFLKDEELSLDSDVAALWLTEDEASPTGGRDPAPSRWCPPVPAMTDLEVLRGLRALGKNPGPITPFTRMYHPRRLEEARAAPGSDFSGHSPELAEALRTGCIPDAQADEDVLAQQFERPDPKRRWREGVVKSSFTYLLLDPRETQDLPARAFSLTPAERLRTFVHAIFYVGKGTRARPDVHLWEALSHRRQPGKQACPKVRQILDIWASGRGVVSLHCFQHVVAVEAYTREACLVDALGIQTLTNQRQGHCYGVVASWPPTRRRRLGVHLLHRALLVFLAEGERELRPQDIQARGGVLGT
ncbi:ankyrin repeat and LEM domain-containing protein 1 isoform X1 [Prionailurus viverrinus]|uniref:ankyrin repeat and LEM domain-containing protein 1 isoform X1 n=1 Tax=Prionailurus viverrinus TaxID=61388 RepID=UPI001FF485E3|nr:ankyrin repeat and LEM domain-containing protein 1 isoform X1 [Prionailurus viverrinus]XP_047694598.1 ankyrin repeat and LEM domain-containing protein 1 isoform X1 [Prionailurus viverrinus]XP_047694613.1 ankyrin repeat and LEM domain-containing protein 1 isoform X1 [Prionailurus viverrinus]